MSFNWYFTSEQLAKLSKHGEEADARMRKQMTTFIHQLGSDLRLSQLTTATSTVFFQRVLTRQDFTTPQQVGGSTLDRYTVATACTFLAGKVEETPKKLRDVIVKSHHIRHSFEHGEDTRYDALRTDSPAYENLRESVLTAERKILQLLAFDLSIEHPYKYIIEFVKRVADGNKKVAQAAWNFVNDSLRTTLCLQYRAHVIASAAIFLAARHCTVQLAGADGKEWFECLDCKIDDLDYIANRILDLYHQAEKSGELKAAVNVEAPSLRSPSMQTPSPRVGSSPSPDIRATPPPPPRPSPFAQPPPPPPVSQPPPPSSRSRSPPPPPPPGRPAEPPQRAGYRPSPPPHQHERERGYNTTPPRRRSPPPRPPSRTFRPPPPSHSHHSDRDRDRDHHYHHYHDDHHRDDHRRYEERDRDYGRDRDRRDDRDRR